MSGTSSTGGRDFAAAPQIKRERAIDPSVFEGLRRLFAPRHWLTALVWTASMALVIGSIAHGVHVFTATPEAAAKMTLGPSWKLAVAIGIYCGVMLYGSYFLLRGVARVGREFELIEQAQVRAEIWANADEVKSVSFLEKPAPFFFTGGGGLADNEKTATFELNEILRHDAQQRRFEPVGIAVERVAEKVLGGSFGIRDAQQLGVRLGILFTFIGIVLSLSGVDVIMGDKQLGDAEIRGAIRNIVGSLGLAFVSSIAGLLASILLQVLGSGLRVRELALVEALQKIATTIQGFYVRAAAETDREQLETRIREHRDEIAAINHEVASRGVEIVNGMKDFETHVRTPLDALRRQSEGLTSAVDAQEKALAAMHDLATRVAVLQGDVVAAQEKAAVAVSRAIGVLTERLVAEVRSGFGATAQAEIVRHVEKASERHDRAMRNMTAFYGVGLLAVGLAIGAAAVVLATVSR